MGKDLLGVVIRRGLNRLKGMDGVVVATTADSGRNQIILVGWKVDGIEAVVKLTASSRRDHRRDIPLPRERTGFRSECPCGTKANMRPWSEAPKRACFSNV
ncbi:hypothetical protein R4F53_21395 [Mycobacterium intracellulare]|uniref:Uncharacterized protein n=1 Tax=Mycobacterium intracellulare TaxID=1767 RepID=A0AAE4RFN6_MYCIT|nr:hypothetical protein [Mycobacterium intracellulare]MDV6979292.1 hypothetical protein [Mycobacterium intracellulare]MDV6984741.1 hypothetical protein [Mycobacterium intracellulare]MDV7014845.1 hypothetical protein [Mycobacterium intracellulare]MDV7031018.1 hypothetical protein [Mycobacterium intracellulare]